MINMTSISPVWMAIAFIVVVMIYKLLTLWYFKKLIWRFKDWFNIKFRNHLRCDNCNVPYHILALTTAIQSDGSTIFLDYNCETLWLGLTN